jgi:PAS domain S-box-containing protein
MDTESTSDATLEPPRPDLVRQSLQLALEAAGGVGLWDWDIVSDRVHADESFALLYGVDPAQAARGAPISAFIDAIHPDDNERISVAIRRSMAGGVAVYAEEYRVVQRDGSVRWVYTRGRCQHDAAGQATRFSGIAVDITDRKLEEQRERTLARLVERLRGLMNPQDIMRAASQALGEHLGVSRAGYAEVDPRQKVVIIECDWTNGEVQSLAGTVCLLQSFGAGIVQRLSAGLTLSVNDVDRDPLTADPGAYSVFGTVGARSLLATPLQKNGRLTAIFCVHDVIAREWTAAEIELLEEVVDRTWAAVARARAEAAQRESEIQRHLAFHSAQLGIWDFNPLTGQLSWDDRCRELFGLPPDAPVNYQTFLDGLHPDDRERMNQVVLDATTAGASGEVLDTYRTIGPQDGVLRWVETHGHAFFENGICVRFIGSVRDVTESRRAHEALKALTETLEQRVADEVAERSRAEAALRQAQKMESIGQLTGGIAHDFNNLLQGIVSSLEVLKYRLGDSAQPTVAALIGGAMNSANRAGALTHRLLAFSRRQPLDPKPVQANPLVLGMADLLRRTLGESIELQLNLSAQPWLAQCDPHQLESALLNLAINARDAMPDGGVLGVVTENCAFDARAARNLGVEAGDYVKLGVSDNGVGMSADVIERAFDPFFTTKPIGQGTGLGLSMIYGFARQSNGHVRIASEPQIGTTVELFLPRSKVISVDEPALPAAAQTPIGANESVLVVEDEPVVRQIVIDVLQDLGYRTLEAADGASALSILQSSEPVDLLVTDIGLPGLNGRQVADAARQLRPQLSVLFMTGYAESAAMAAPLAPGMSLITKPFSVDTLRQRMRSLMQRA